MIVSQQCPSSCIMLPVIAASVFRYLLGGGALAAKWAHKLVADSHGVVVKSFHVENEIYAEKGLYSVV